MRFVELPTTTHARVVEAVDDSLGFHAFIAVHDSTLGPAVGGTRLWPYASRESALADVMRLSEAMSYKAALAGVPFGGGKSVLIGESRTIDRRATFLAHGRFIDALQGMYIAGEDVGTTPADMHVIREVTPWAAGLTDPSESTGHGVCQAIRAAAEMRWGAPSVVGRTILVQGVGNVGACVARELAAEGARIVVADIDTARAHRIADECEATVVSPTAILETEGDVLAPCALGGILNGETIPRLRVAVVAGAANNMLGGPGDDTALDLRGILYIPDFVANAGGIIHGAQEVCGWSASQSRAATTAIAATAHRVVAIAEERGVTTAVAALQLAKERIAMGRQAQSV